MESAAPIPRQTTVECGQSFQAPAAGMLALVGRFPAHVQVGEESLVGTVEVTTRESLQGLAPPGADVFLLRDGRVVTVPVPQDAVGILWGLEPGETARVPAETRLVSCDSEEPLPPGTYELYTRLVIDTDQGGIVESFGGPWPLEVS